MQFDNQKTRNVADAVAKILAGETVSEGLKGDQHKIDKNKNNKIDAHDFELLQKEKNVKQEASCNKMRKEDARLAKKGEGQVYKESESLKEVSKKTLRSYIPKAANSLSNNAQGRAFNISANMDKTNKDMQKHYDQRMTVRMKGIHNATKQLTKEEDGNVDEAVVKKVNPKTGATVITYTGEDAKKKRATPGKYGYGPSRAKSLAKMGLKQAIKKEDIDEETEQIDEATPSRQQVKQAFGIARDKRYAGGNMTGAVKAMQKLNKGLAQHPAVEKELKKQNEEAEQLDEYTPDKSGATRIQGRAYGASKPEKHAVDTMSGPTRKELTAIEKEKKVKKPFKEMLELYADKGLKALSEMTMTEEPDQETFEKELEMAKKKATQKKTPEEEAGVAKAAVQSVKVEEDVEQIDEKEMTDDEMKKREDIVMGMKKNLQGFKDRYGARAKDVMYATATKQAMKDED
jgi:hypothetical protein